MTVFSPPQSWIGRRGEFDAPVTEADTAMAVGSGDVAVLATPRLIAWMERAAVLAVDDQMAPEVHQCRGVGRDRPSAADSRRSARDDLGDGHARGRRAHHIRGRSRSCRAIR